MRTTADRFRMEQLIPENGDTYILSGWNPMKNKLKWGLVAEAQLELKDKADKYVAK